MAVSKGFKSASGLAQGKQDELNAEGDRNRKIVGDYWYPPNTLLYFVGASGKVLKTIGKNKSEDTMNDVVCIYNPGLRKWGCYAIPIKTTPKKFLTWVKVNIQDEDSIVILWNVLDDKEVVITDEVEDFNRTNDIIWEVDNDLSKRNQFYQDIYTLELAEYIAKLEDPTTYPNPIEPTEPVDVEEPVWDGTYLNPASLPSELDFPTKISTYSDQDPSDGYGDNTYHSYNTTEYSNDDDQDNAIQSRIPPVIGTGLPSDYYVNMDIYSIYNSVYDGENVSGVATTNQTVDDDTTSSEIVTLHPDVNYWTNTETGETFVVWREITFNYSYIRRWTQNINRVYNLSSIPLVYYDSITIISSEVRTTLVTDKKYLGPLGNTNIQERSLSMSATGEYKYVQDTPAGNTAGSGDVITDATVRNDSGTTIFNANDSWDAVNVSEKISDEYGLNFFISVISKKEQKYTCASPLPVYNDHDDYDTPYAGLYWRNCTNVPRVSNNYPAVIADEVITNDVNIIFSPDKTVDINDYKNLSNLKSRIETLASGEIISSINIGVTNFFDENEDEYIAKENRYLYMEDVINTYRESIL